MLREVIRWRVAIDWIEAMGTRHGIDCAFAGRPLIRGRAGSDPRQRPKLEEEVAAGRAHQARAPAGGRPWPTGGSTANSNART